MWLVGLAAALSAAPATGESRAPVPARWNVDWGDTRCSLARRITGSQAGEIAIRRLPGSATVEMRVLGGNDRAQPGARPATLMLAGIDRSFSGNARDVFFGRGGPTGFAIYDLPEDFVDAFARARALRIVVEGRDVVDTPLPGVAKAVAALRQCSDGVLRRWGIDPAADAALRRRPEPAESVTSWIRHTDYPDSALRARAGGTVVAKITVAPDGRVADCSAVVSSGNAALDRQTCALVTKRGRFRAAAGADGTAVAAPYIASVRWATW